MKSVRGLLAADLKSLFRDSMLLLLLVYPFILGLVTRILVPILTERLPRLQLERYYDLIGGGVVVLQVSLIVGTGVGLMLLDEKDDRTLLALQCTPLPFTGYMAWRVGLPMLCGFAAIWLNTLLLNNIIPPPDPAGLVLVAVPALLTLPLYALFIGALAQNKVQGIAFSKALGPFLLVPLVAYFVPAPWQWLFGVMPTYWPAKAYWVLLARGQIWPWVLGGLACGLIWNWFWLRLFERRVLRRLF